MIGVPDIHAASLALVMVVASPILMLGAVFIALAASAGAESSVSLSRWRHFMSTMIGAAIGSSVTATVLVCAYVSAEILVWLFSWLNSLLLLLAVLVIAILLGALVANFASKSVSPMLAWYRCVTCGERFWSPHATQEHRYCRVKKGLS